MQDDKSLTFIVPVYGAGGLYLPRCLHSLLENQDYPNKSVIVVFDGDGYQMQSALKQQEEFKDRDDIKFFIKEHGGAPSARNYGFEKAKELYNPDYVCFFDCDSFLKAGGLRTWMKTFEENPDVDFVYNGYRYTMKDKYNTGIPSLPFDEWLLTCNNYISSMNPIKTSKVVKWDESLDGLQDWDFWLRVVKNGSKGKMVNEWLVVTESPDDESISGKTSQNHLEIFTKVREKNGIVNRDRVVTSMGAPFQAKRRAKFLDGDYRDPQMLIFKNHDYKAVVSMGYYVESPVGAWAIFSLCNDDCKKIIHFIGTDVYQLYGLKYLDLKYLKENLPNSVDHIFANAPWLVDELEDMGIKAELLYCPIDPKPYKVTELPKDFTVAVYRSDSNPMHNESFMFDVARACPDINFKFFGGTAIVAQDMPKNIKYVGTVEEKDMPDFISNTSCLVRISVHDGFPATIAEWAMSGRPFISNIKDIPFNRYIEVAPTEQTYMSDKDKVIKEIRNLQRNIKNDNVQNLDKARDYYIKLLDPKKYVKRMNEVIYDK